MKEMNLGRILIENRRKRGITQDELAAHIGVSKGAVSKWETGSSLPDISLLPQLASYFDISIDELIGYQPQMEKEDIQKLYIRLSKDFSVLPFDEVLAECLEIIKKYYSCLSSPVPIRISFDQSYCAGYQSGANDTDYRKSSGMFPSCEVRSGCTNLQKDGTVNGSVLSAAAPAPIRSH